MRYFANRWLSLVRPNSGSQSSKNRGNVVDRVLKQTRSWLLVGGAVVLAFSCAGGDPTDDLPSDCDAYLNVSRECLHMDDARIKLMRQSIHSRLVAANESEKRAAVVNECARGASQLSKVCHGR